MAGFGARSYGRGKRQPSSAASSSSSYFSIITLVIFLAFCLLGVWMLTTSSAVPVQVATTAHRTFRGFVPSSRKSNTDPAEDTRPRNLAHEGVVRDVRAGSGEEDDEATPRVGEGEDKHAAVIRLPGEDDGSGGKETEGGSEGAGEDGAGKEGVSEEGQLPAEEGREQKPESRSEEAEAGGEAKEQDKFSSEEESQSQQEKERSEEGQQIQKSGEEGEGQRQPQGEDGQQQVDQQDNDQEQKGENEGGEETGKSSETVTEDLKASEIEGKGEANQGTDEELAGNERSEKLEESEKQDVGADTEGRSLDQTGEAATSTDTDTDRENQEHSSQERTQGDGGDSEERNNQEQRNDKIEEENATADSVGERKADATEGEETRKQSSHFEDGNETVGLGSMVSRNWELCNVTAGPDYIPCLDNVEALKHVRITGHYEHRERHCPEEGPACLVPLPEGYRQPIMWPRSRDKIWYNNVPHKKLAEVKGHQNWMKVTGEHIYFPGGGTQFIHGALHYIDFIQKAVPRIGWGKHTRVILDVGCGVASFGGYLFERDVIAMSFAPKDEHEAQVQFALERGIPAISAVMGTQRLPFPSDIFDIVHCARCRVPWHVEGGRLLLELNRVLRPGGYFVWSATPVYQKLKEDVEIWDAMSALTKSMCWDLVTIKKDRINSVGAAIYRKPVSNVCYDNRKSQNPPMCKDDDDANAAWYVPLQSCMHRVPIHSSERGSQWPVDWPRRLHAPPYWLNKSRKGIYGKSEQDDFKADSEFWKHTVEKSYLNAMGINWSKVRNIMDMRAVYGGFAAALKDMKVWVMNVVNIDSVDTLPIIYERGLFGIYHDWCESFSTYPRTYDLLHADHLFSKLKKRCYLLPVMVEVDRILRPGGTLIVRDESAIVSEVETMLKSLHWDVRMTFSKNHEGILCAEKSDWRPEAFSTAS